MIYLFAGVPGAGKTVCLLDKLINDIKPASVKYIGLDLQYRPQGWDEIDLDELQNWTKFSEGTSVVIDEAQDYFLAQYKVGYAPDWIQELAKHRHYGIDFYLTSQSWNLISPFVRPLISYTYWLRPYQHRKASHLYKYTGVPVYNKPDYKLKEVYRYPVDIFSLYQSTKLDTGKSFVSILQKKLRFWVLVLLLIVSFGGWFIYSLWSDRFFSNEVNIDVIDDVVDDSLVVKDQVQNVVYVSYDDFDLIEKDIVGMYLGQVNSSYFFEIRNFFGVSGRYSLDGILDLIRIRGGDVDAFQYSDKLRTFYYDDFIFSRVYVDELVEDDVVSKKN